MIDPRELDAESAELLPGREALGKLTFNFAKTTNITKHVANIHAHNESQAVNEFSPLATAQSEAAQSITVSQ
jgi:hypothetical protein